MRHLAAYLLLVVGGNSTPSAEDVTKLLSQAGIEVDEERLSQLITDLEGKDIAELIELGKDKLVVGGMSSGGGGGSAAAPAAAGDAAPAAAPVKEEKPKEEVVDALDGGNSWFLVIAITSHCLRLPFQLSTTLPYRHGYVRRWWRWRRLLSLSRSYWFRSCEITTTIKIVSL
jgi:large subunit ribosomal protein LP2